MYVCVKLSHLLHRASWQPGRDSLVNLSSLVLTHRLTFVSIRHYLVQHWPRWEREMDKWMGLQQADFPHTHTVHTTHLSTALSYSV